MTRFKLFIFALPTQFILSKVTVHIEIRLETMEFSERLQVLKADARMWHTIFTSDTQFKHTELSVHIPSET